jgi:hypothetical protein
MRTTTFWMLVTALAAGCVQSTTDIGDDDDGASDGDADGDTDGDADGDSDGDSDGDADSDADADSDGDTDGDADSDADGDTDLPAVTWGQTYCQGGGFMNDCGMFGCGNPPPSLTENRVFAAGADMEAAILKITTPNRSGLVALPFSDIKARLTHNGITVKFYNQYEGNNVGSLLTPNYAFPSEWRIPHFWGTGVGGTYTLYFEDSEYSMGGFDLIEWCLTFVDPAVSSYVTGGYWPSGDTGSIQDYNSTDDYARTTVYQLHIETLARVDAAEPVLNLTVNHANPADLSIKLTAADGTVFTVKQQGTATVPASTTLTNLQSVWLTGRYQLAITDHAAGNTGSVSSWDITM